VKGRPAQRLWAWARRVPYRFGKELRAPKTPLGRRLYALRRRLGAESGRRTLSDGFIDPDALVACYDLGHWPITYDFLWFMVAADLARREAGRSSLHVVFVATEDWEAGSEGTDYYTVIDGAARRQRLFDILIPCAGVLPTIRGFTVTGSRAEATTLIGQSGGRVFPDSYVPQFPRLDYVSFSNLVFDAARAGTPVPSFEAPVGARDWVGRWLQGLPDGRPYVTITLRYFGYNPIRNSNLEAWGAFARELEAEGFHAVVVPDTHMTLDPLPPALAGVTLLKEAAWHVHLRAALYEAAFLNLGINTGPMSLCWFNPRCRFIIYKQVIEEGGVASREAQIERGHDPLEPVPFASPFQKLVLEPDDLPVIRREFQAMRGRIDADPAAAGISVPKDRR